MEDRNGESADRDERIGGRHEEGKKQWRRSYDKQAAHHCISLHFQASVHKGCGDGTQMNESNKPRQARMDRIKCRIIFRTLRDDRSRYSVPRHHLSKIWMPQVLWLHWYTTANTVMKAFQSGF